MASGKARRAQPVHPGQHIKKEVLDALGITVTTAAKALGVTRPALSALLNGRADLSPEMALRLEKAFDLNLDALLQMQTLYDIALVRRREASIKVERYVPPLP